MTLLATGRILARYWLLIAIIALAVGLHGYKAYLRGALTPAGAYTSQDYRGSAEVRAKVTLASKIGRYTTFHNEVFHGEAGSFPGERTTMLIAHGFNHLNLLHLAINMAMLLPLGVIAINRIGTLRFALLFFATMALAAVCYGLVRPPNIRMAGASGAIHGLAGAAIVWAWIDGAGQALRWRKPFIFAAIVAALNAWFSYLTDGNFAWELHLAGLLIGGLAAATVLRARMDAPRGAGAPPSMQTGPAPALGNKAVR